MITPLVGGGYVTVWQTANQNGSGFGVVAQIYNAFGQRIGTPFQIEENAIGNQTDPQVAATSDGGFVVAWDDNTGTQIYARKFDATGSALTGDIVVDTLNYSTDYKPAITALSGGGFVVSWSSYRLTTFNYVIVFQRFDAAGVPQGGETVANSTIASSQQDSNLAPLGTGFVAVWTDEGGLDGSSTGIFFQRFNDQGVAQGGETPVNQTTTNAQTDPQIVELSGGRFVIVWTSNTQPLNGNDASSTAVVARVFEANGTAVGDEIQINQTTFSTQSQPAVTATSDGGFFVAYYSDYNASNAFTADIYGRHFNADGVAQGDEAVLNENSAGALTDVSVAGLANGAVIATWQQTEVDGSGAGIVQRVFDVANGALVPIVAPTLDGIAPVRMMREADFNTGAQIIDSTGAAAVSAGTASDFDGGRLIVQRSSTTTNFSVLDLSGDDEISVRDQGTGAGQIGVTGSAVTFGGISIGTITSDGGPETDLIIEFNAGASLAAVEALVENLTYRSLSDDPGEEIDLTLYLEDGAGGSAAPVTVSILVEPETDAPQPIGAGEDRVNAFTDNNQNQPDVAALDDGGWVVVWTSRGQDEISASSDGVILQRYDSTGAPIGGEQIVNTSVFGSQNTPRVEAISTGPLAGGWVVTWYNSQGPSDGYVRAQLFDSAGAPVGGELTPAAGNQFVPVLDVLDNGNIVIVSQDFSADIDVQVIDQSGANVVAQFTANTTLGGTQDDAEVVALSGGRFLVIWTGSGLDGSRDAVVGRIFNNDGTPVVGPAGSEFVVNTFTNSSQYEPEVTALSGGGFVVVWRDDSGLDGSGNGVFGQVYDASGARVGEQFLVNEYTSSTQYQPDVIALPGGGFMVAYASFGGGRPSYFDVMVQTYDATGDRIDTEIPVSSLDLQSHTMPRLDLLANGDVIVVWESLDVSGLGVYQRIVGDPANYVGADGDPQIAGVNTTVTLAEADVNAAPQLLFPSVNVGDADSADFAGGRLSLSRVADAADQVLFNAPDDLSQDNLFISTTSAISVSSSIVSFNGTAIGAITSAGQGGDELAVLFNGNASAAAVEALLEAITYSNPSDDPEQTRQYSVTLTDGDGGTSARQILTIEVTPEVEAEQAVGGERQVNTHERFDQSEQSVTGLANGGYVVVWRTYDQETSFNYSIMGQIFDGDGTAVGAEFVVSPSVAGGEFSPSVSAFSAADGGGFVVAYQASSLPILDQIQAQRFDASGNSVGAPISVPSEGTSTQGDPSVVALSGGGFAVSWRSYNPDTNSPDIRLQIFDNTDAKVGMGTETNGEAVVNSVVTTGTQDAPEMTLLTGGNLAIVWRDDSGSDGSGQTIRAALFDQTGQEVTADFQVNTSGIGSQSSAAI